MKSLLSLLGCLVLNASVLAAPAEIILLRHAEKPPEGPTLNARGYERARALPAVFTSDTRLLSLGRVAAIFGAHPAKAGGSVRSLETIEPTAKALGVQLDSRFTKDQVADLVREVLTNPAYDGKTVVVCWEHKKIPSIVRAFGWASGPDRWDDAVFDRFWVLDLSRGKPVAFHDLPERALAGDSQQ